MSSGHCSEVKFEIGHVLFIDIVGHSKLLINQQSQLLETLRKVVRGTEQFRSAEAEGKLLRLPTGDGGARPAAARFPCSIRFGMIRAFKSFAKKENDEGVNGH
jgi:hypothetical protein